ncbi:MAG TPA: GNAT family N-acetyltransferase [Chloroflexota bacterium]|jgi:GNAT superfamily N-acetyltransferase|nr:GNAT family N-acetyltransferase [Chloroflexota bacterium]
MTASFVVRPLGGSAHEHEALWPLLYEMGHGTLPPEGIGSLPPDVAERIARLCQRPEHFVPVAVAGGPAGALVGYAWVQDYGPGLRRWWSVARLHDLFTVPRWRQRGVGRGLFEAVRRWAGQRETVKYLEWQASLPAVPFYERLGFTGDTRSDLEQHPYFELTIR